MLKLSPSSRSPRAAFMLIELAVASMVIGFALLALLGLGHIAERAATETEGELRATLFADEFFTTLRLYSDHYAQSTNHIDWIEFWQSMQSGEIEIPLSPMMDGIMANPSDRDFPRLIKGGNREHVAHWKQDSQSAPVGTEIAEYALRYRITISSTILESAMRSTSISDQENMILATLHIWPGVSRTGDPPLNFFTSFSYSGGLP